MATTKTKKTTKRTIAAKKTTPKKTVSVKRDRTEVTNNSSSKKQGVFSRVRLKDLLIPAVVIVVIIFLGVFKNQFVVASVNGQPVNRLELINQLEKKDGKTILEQIITEKLIQQEAKKRGVKVSDEDVKAEVANIEKTVSAQGQNIDTLLAQQGMTRADLNEQVKIQLLLKKMVGSNVSVSDKDVEDYIEQNKEAMPTEITDTTKGQIKQQLEQQKLNEKIQSFVADLQSKAKIQYLRNY